MFRKCEEIYCVVTENYRNSRSLWKFSDVGYSVNPCIKYGVRYNNSKTENGTTLNLVKFD